MVAPSETSAMEVEDAGPAKQLSNIVIAAIGDEKQSQASNGGSDYGLRRRGVISPRAGGGIQLGDDLLKSFKQDDEAYTKQLEKSGIHPLGKTEIKTDMNLIRGLSRSQEEVQIEESKVRPKTVVHTAMDVDNNAIPTESLRVTRKVKPAQNGVKAKGGKGKRKAADMAFDRSDYRVPFEGTLRARDTAERKHKICEREYQSVRHAYMNKIREISQKQQAQLAVLDGLKEHLVQGEEELSKLADATKVVYAAVETVKSERIHREKLEKKIASLEKLLSKNGVLLHPGDDENHKPMALTNPDTHTMQDTNKMVEGGTKQASRNSNKKDGGDQVGDILSMNLNDPSSNADATNILGESGKVPDDVLPNLLEWLEREQRSLDEFERMEESIRENWQSTQVATSYGPGYVKKLNRNGIVEVELGFGTGYLPEQAINPPTVEKVKGDGKRSGRGVSKGVPSVVPKEKLIILSQDTTGAPRGVRLNLSIVSDEPDFAVPPCKDMDPTWLHHRFKDFGHVDVDDYQEMPQSWGGPSSAPWIGKRKRATADDKVVFSRDELQRWQSERLELLVLRGDFIRLKFKYRQLLSSARRREKAFTSHQNVQELLVDRLAAARTELHNLRARCARLLSEKQGTKEVKKHKSLDGPGQTLQPRRDDHDDEDDAQGGNGSGPNSTQRQPVRRGTSTRSRSGSTASAGVETNSSTHSKRTRIYQEQVQEWVAAADNFQCGLKRAIDCRS